MNTLSALLLFCLAAIAYGFPETQIVGGRDAPNGMFPYQVSLRKNGNHFCGGSVIDSRTILTAAHCVQGLGSGRGVTVHVGTNLLSSAGDTYGVEKIVAHSGYNSRTVVNDVALIRVNRNINFNGNVKAIRLASGGNNYEGSSCVLSGWGTLRAGGNLPNVLQYINLRVFGLSQCKQTHRNLQSSQICTFTRSGEGACNGDSGGPLVANNVQIGIVSYGIPCGVGKPDVYTRVSSFNSWINSHKTYLQNEESGPQPEDGVYIS